MSVRKLPDGRNEYTQGGYTVIVADDGAIVVNHGDSLSKYSMAIFGDFNSIGRKFGRMKAGNVKSFEESGDNINLIYPNETIYQTSRYKLRHGGGGGASPPSGNFISEAEARRLIKETLERDYNLHGQKLKDAADFAFWLGMGGRGLTGGAIAADIMLGAATSVGAVSSAGSVSIVMTSLISGAGLIGGVGGALLIPVAALIVISKNLNVNVSNNALRGVVYGIVAWSFGHQKPPLPPKIRQNILSSHLNNPQLELQKITNAWNSAVNTAFVDMDKEARKLGNREMLKKAYQYKGNGNAKKLADLLMEQMAKEHFSTQLDKDNFLQPWSDYPRA